MTELPHPGLFQLMNPTTSKTTWRGEKSHQSSQTWVQRSTCGTNHLNCKQNTRTNSTCNTSTTTKLRVLLRKECKLWKLWKNLKLSWMNKFLTLYYHSLLVMNVKMKTRQPTNKLKLIKLITNLKNFLSWALINSLVLITMMMNGVGQKRKQNQLRITLKTQRFSLTHLPLIATQTMMVIIHLIMIITIIIIMVHGNG